MEPPIIKITLTKEQSEQVGKLTTGAYMCGGTVFGQFFRESWPENEYLKATCIYLPKPSTIRLKTWFETEIKRSSDGTARKEPKPKNPKK